MSANFHCAICGPYYTEDFDRLCDHLQEFFGDVTEAGFDETN